MSDRVTYDEWMSDADALLWHIERDPLLRSTILSIWLLDQSPEHSRVLDTFDRALQEVPRLRQRVVADPAGVSTPSWEEDVLFDPEYHIRRLRAPGGGELREVLDVASPIVSQAFDKDRPVWEAHLVDGLSGGRAAMILKAHHALSDGVGGIEIMMSLLDLTRESRKVDAPAGGRARARHRDHRSSLFEHLGEAVFHRTVSEAERGLKAARALGEGWRNLAFDPLGVTQRFGQTASSIGRVLRPVAKPLSPLMSERSMSMRLAVLDFELEPLKRAAKRSGGKLNDAFVAAVAGGLRLYHERKGRPARSLRMTMPVNLRSGESGRRAGNQFAALRVEVPVGIDDPLRRMQRVRELLTEQKEEPALAWYEEITAAINRLGVAPATQLAGSMFKAVDFVSSNVPGPAVEVFLAGSRVEALYPFAPPTGAALSVTLLSYNGRVHIGVNANSGAVSDLPLLMESLNAGFEEILAL